MFEERSGGDDGFDSVGPDASSTAADAGFVPGPAEGGWAIPGVSRGLGSQDAGSSVVVPVDPSPVVAELLTAFEAVADRTAADLPGAVALADTSALLGLAERLRALTLTHMADVSARKLHVAAGTPTTASWLADQDVSLPAGEIALAKRLSNFACLDSAVHSGALSVTSAALVATALCKAKPHLDRPDLLIDGQSGRAVLTAVLCDGIPQLVCEALAGLADTDPRLLRLMTQLSELAASGASQLSRLEGGLVLLAAHLEPAQLRRALARLLDALVPSVLERHSKDRHARRGFTLHQHTDGSGWYVTAGELDLETGELLQTVLAAELAVDRDNPVDTIAYSNARDAGWTPADGQEGLASSTPAHPDSTEPDPTSDTSPGAYCPGPRTFAQRRHDALRNGLRRYLASGIAGMRAKAVPQIHVTISLNSLHDEPGSLGPVGGSGAVLPRSLVRKWWCDSAVTRFVLSAGRKVLETSHTQRTLKAHERDAKNLETGGWCQGAGCRCGPGNNPEQTLIPHHADPWATSGSTSVSQTVNFCDQTHHHLHAGRAIRLKDGRWLDQNGWLNGPPGTH